MIIKVQDELYREFRKINTDEEKVIALFKNMKAKDDVYALAFLYENKYKKNLWREIDKSLNTEEQYAIISYIKALKRHA